MPPLLAIETSQHVGGVALRRAGGEVDVEYLAAKKRHDDDLIPAIDRMFRRAGMAPRDLRDGTVAVSIGPGGFTGLRIAVSTAKMLAETAQARIVAVPSALVAAESFSREPTGERAALAALVALASKNDSAWITRVTRQDHDWHIVGQPGLAEAAALDLNGVEAVLADDHLPAAMRQRCDAAGVTVREPIFDPRACLRIAEGMFERGEFTDPLALLPLYPRQPEAVTLWDQRRNVPTSKGPGR